MVQEQESGLERLTSENKLVNIRLSSLSEILSIQEAEVAKVQHTLLLIRDLRLHKQLYKLTQLLQFYIITYVNAF